ncbi:hypothetical protein M0534_01450 [Methylonatrum kenyense]|uniref:hypothetical protein n=1 Tax=Methylonatrum kenyense TaxID=455253 RepID=UPI0020C053CC|nr:hypothetical protein [Methylonatrum kenyense]MCK8514997.1 hypothetical protein [Methylonatrum kenyense]
MIHLDASEHLPSLTLSGRIASVDACFTRCTGRLQACGPGLNRVVIGQRLVADADAAILLHATPADLRSLRRARQLKQLELLGCALGGIQDFGSPPELHRLRIFEGTPCQVIMVPQGLKRLEIEGFADLTDIIGSGAFLRLRDCRTNRLDLQDDWRRVLVDGGNYERLEAQHAKAIELRGVAVTDCLRVGRATRLRISGDYPRRIDGGRVDFRTGSDRAINQLLHARSDGPLGGERELHDFFGRAANRMECLHRLYMLKRMIGKASPERLWELRCMTHAAQQRSPSQPRPAVTEAVRFAENAWRWDFPNGLDYEGWAADLALAEAICDSPSIAGILQRLGKDGQLQPVRALGNHIHVRTQQGQLNAVPPTFIKAFQTGLDLLLERFAPDPSEPVRAADLQPILNALVALHRRQQANKLRQRLPAWTAEEDQVALLDYLAAHGLQAARIDLIAFAQQARNEPTSPQIGEQAWRAALAPPRSAALANGTRTAGAGTLNKGSRSARCHVASYSGRKTQKRQVKKTND